MYRTIDLSVNVKSSNCRNFSMKLLQILFILCSKLPETIVWCPQTVATELLWAFQFLMQISFDEFVLFTCSDQKNNLQMKWKQKKLYDQIKMSTFASESPTRHKNHNWISMCELWLCKWMIANSKIKCTLTIKCEWTLNQVTNLAES